MYFRNVVMGMYIYLNGTRIPSYVSWVIKEPTDRES